jgi:hypothetical protein
MSLPVFFGCESDFLDRNPRNQISSATFWLSKSDFDKALTANYGIMFGNEVWQGSLTGIWGFKHPVLDHITDNASPAYAGYGRTTQIAGGDVSPTTGGYVSSVYNSCYQAIARQHVFLQELARYEGSDFTEADKKVYEAEVRFLRAFHYFQLYEFYGEVPLITEPLTVENMIQPKAEKAKILEQVIIDLDYAIANLKAVPYYENAGHATKTTAQAFKARALLYAAYGDNGAPDANILGQVRDLCLEVTPSYSLSPLFTDIFRTKGQAGNKEIIFSINYLAPNSSLVQNGTDIVWGMWWATSPMDNFIRSFHNTDGLPWDESPLTDPEDIYKNRDKRLFYTVFDETTMDFGDGLVHDIANAQPHGLKKFLDPENQPADYSILSEQNAVVLRLGEILLMYAEAQNEIAGPDASVYQAVNDLRARVDMPPYPAGLTKEQMRERIRLERRWELAFEQGLRYYDLKRWHIAGQVLNAVSDAGMIYKWEDRFYHWPLPQSEVEISQGVLVQNPDYN